MVKFIKRKSVILVVILAAALISGAVCRGSCQQQNVIVRLDEAVQLSDCGLDKAAGIDENSDLKEIADNVYLCSADVAAKLKSLGLVKAEASDDAMLLQDAYKATQQSHITVSADSAWNHTDADGNYDCRGDGVTVALIDSGVYQQHSDFNSDKFISVSEEYDGYTQWHGTFVAGIIAAQLNNLYIDGIAPDVNIMSLCVTDHGGNTGTSSVIAAINYAVENGADVINISISGTTKNALLEEACKSAYDKGVIIISCVGNASSSKDAMSYRYPAAFDSVISVSSCDSVASGAAFPDYSCYNDCVDACAPGGNITSLFIDGATITRTGTSFSAPVVAAMAAMAKQQDPSIDTEAFRALLAESCLDLGDPGKDPYYGYGMVDIDKFVSLITANSSENPETSDPENPDNTEAGSEETDAAEDAGEYLAELLFEDIDEDEWYYDSVSWAVNNKITSGKTESLFAPDAECTRAEFVTFLWRAAGKPAPASVNTQFTDVPADKWYAEAVAWAAECGITTGTSKSTFSPEDLLNRAQVVQFLYKYAKAEDGDASEALSDGSLEAPYEETAQDVAGIAFADVDPQSWYAKAVAWAVENGITSGMTQNTFCPEISCTRAQTVTFLHRFFGK